MIFTSCFNCGKVKFFDEKNSIIWVKLKTEENLALEILCKSEPLIAMVGGYEEYNELCDECVLVEAN